MVKVPERLQKRVLDHIIDLGTTAQELCREARDLVHVLAEDGLLGPRVTIKGARDELVVGRGWVPEERRGW